MNAISRTSSKVNAISRNFKKPSVPRISVTFPLPSVVPDDGYPFPEAVHVAMTAMKLVPSVKLASDRWMTLSDLFWQSIYLEKSGWEQRVKEAFKKENVKNGHDIGYRILFQWVHENDVTLTDVYSIFFGDEGKMNRNSAALIRLNNESNQFQRHVSRFPPYWILQVILEVISQEHCIYLPVVVRYAFFMIRYIFESKKMTQSRYSDFVLFLLRQYRFLLRPPGLDIQSAKFIAFMLQQSCVSLIQSTSEKEISQLLNAELQYLADLPVLLNKDSYQAIGDVLSILSSCLEYDFCEEMIQKETCHSLLRLCVRTGLDYERCQSVLLNLFRPLTSPEIAIDLMKQILCHSMSDSVQIYLIPKMHEIIISRDLFLSNDEYWNEMDAPKICGFLMDLAHSIRTNSAVKVKEQRYKDFIQSLRSDRGLEIMDVERRILRGWTLFLFLYMEQFQESLPERVSSLYQNPSMQQFPVIEKDNKLRVLETCLKVFGWPPLLNQILFLRLAGTFDTDHLDCLNTILSLAYRDLVTKVLKDTERESIASQKFCYFYATAGILRFTNYYLQFADMMQWPRDETLQAALKLCDQSLCTLRYLNIPKLFSAFTTLHNHLLALDVRHTLPRRPSYPPIPHLPDCFKHQQKPFVNVDVAWRDNLLRPLNSLLL